MRGSLRFCLFQDEVVPEFNISISRGFGSAWLAALSLLTFIPEAHAASITLYGDVADTQVHLGGIVSTGPSANSGEIGVNGGFDYSNV